MNKKAQKMKKQKQMIKKICCNQVKQAKIIKFQMNIMTNQKRMKKWYLMIVAACSNNPAARANQTRKILKFKLNKKNKLMSKKLRVIRKILNHRRLRLHQTKTSIQANNRIISMAIINIQ